MGNVKSVEIGKTYEYRVIIEINGVEKLYRCNVIVLDIVGHGNDRVVVGEEGSDATLEVPTSRLFEIVTEAEVKRLGERSLILQLAMTEASRKRDECVHDVNEIVSALGKGLLSEIDHTRYVKDEAYLRECVAGWEETIREIQVWQNELDNS